MDGQEVRRSDDLDAGLQTSDVSVLLQNHAAFDVHHLARRAGQLLDTRGVVPPQPGVHRL